MRKLMFAAAVVLGVAGFTSPAWAAGPVHVRFDAPGVPAPETNPCTGDPGIGTETSSVVAKIDTFPDGSLHLVVHGTGTFEFDATDPAAPDYVATELPLNNQFKVDSSGNGTFKFGFGYRMTGTDGSTIFVQYVAHFDVVDFVPVAATLEHGVMHCP